MMLYTPENTKSTRSAKAGVQAGPAQIALNNKGRFALSQKALIRLGVCAGDKIVIAEIGDKVYIAKVPPSLPGWTLRRPKKLDLLFYSMELNKKIREKLAPKDKGSIVLLLCPEPESLSVENKESGPIRLPFYKLTKKAT